MFQKLSNFHTNLEDDTFIPETNNLISETNLFSISNYNTLNPNDYKIEDRTVPNDLFFLNKYSLLNHNNLPNDIFSKTNLKLKKEKIVNGQVLNKNIFSIIKNDNHTQSTDWMENEKTKSNLFQKSRLGRKRKNDNSIRDHDKYASDNLRRKAKNLVIDYALEFINEKIRMIYKGNIGNGMNKKVLLALNQDFKSDTSIENNKNFLYKTLGEIFSSNISTRFSDYYPEYNKNIIQRLLNEKDENKRLAFKRLFDIQFLQCIEAFCGNDDCEELKGFKKYRDIKKNLEEKHEQKYIEKLENFLQNYENNIKDKTGRKSRRSNEDKDKEKEKEKEKDNELNNK